MRAAPRQWPRRPASLMIGHADVRRSVKVREVKRVRFARRTLKLIPRGQLIITHCTRYNGEAYIRTETKSEVPVGNVPAPPCVFLPVGNSRSSSLP